MRQRVPLTAAQETALRQCVDCWSGRPPSVDLPRVDDLLAAWGFWGPEYRLTVAKDALILDTRAST